MTLRKIASNYLWTPGGFVRHPMVTVDAQGTILSVATCADPDRQPGTEFYAGVLVPGFVNAHCHLELSYLKGAIPEGSGFAGFARAMGEVRGRFSEAERLQAIQAADAAMRAEGVVAVGDVANGDTSFGVKAASDIAYHTFAEYFGLRNPPLETLSPLLLHPHTSLTPHSTYSVQEGPFRAICGEGMAPLSIHFMESAAEADLFARQGELWEWYRKVGFECDFLDYATPAERIVRSTPSTRSIVLVHNCCVTDADVALLMSHFTGGVHWCLCPRSNDFISRLKPPVELLRSRGASICIGTDSLASNRTLSMLEELRALPGVPLAERLGWATLGGARALGFEQMLGTVEVGKRPGLCLLSGLDYDRMELSDNTRLLRLL